MVPIVRCLYQPSNIFNDDFHIHCPYHFITQNLASWCTSRCPHWLWINPFPPSLLTLKQPATWPMPLPIEALGILNTPYTYWQANPTDLIHSRTTTAVVLLRQRINTVLRTLSELETAPCWWIRSREKQKRRKNTNKLSDIFEIDIYPSPKRRSYWKRYQPSHEKRKHPSRFALFNSS